MVIYVERDGVDAASALLTVDEEFYNNNNDDCGTFDLPLGISAGTGNLSISVPIHEKDNGRTVRVTATVGTTTDSETITNNVSDEVGLINLSLLAASSNVRTISVEICSPAGNGDSFGVRVVVISTGCNESAREPVSSNSSSIISSVAQVDIES